MKKRILLVSLGLVALSGCALEPLANHFVPERQLDTLAKTKILKHYEDLGDDSMAGIGTSKVAVIPVWFLDSYDFYSPVEKYKMLDAINKAFFGTPQEVGWHSVKSYYEAESFGLFHLGGKASYWFDYPGYSSEFYSFTQSKRVSFLRQATDYFFAANPLEDRLSYDADGDGFLDLVSLIYAAPDYATAGRSEDSMWAFRSYLDEESLRDVTNPGPNNFFWASTDFLSGGIQAMTNSKVRISTETFIHEFGHGFGIVDYYDYNNWYGPAGDATMQDHNVCGHDPYSVMAIGWADPYIPTESMTLTIGAFQSTHDMILLTPEWNSIDSVFDEYVLLELYTSSGLNEYHDVEGLWLNDNFYNWHHTDEVGIRLWHVDARLTERIDRGEFVMPRYTYSEDLVVDPSIPNTLHAMTNTYPVDGGKNECCSPLGSAYYDYNLLELIQRSEWMSAPSEALEFIQYLFQEGDGWSLSPDKMGKYGRDEQGNLDFSTYYWDTGRYFVNDAKLNSGKDLGWSFVIEKIEGTGDEATATIRLIKD